MILISLPLFHSLVCNTRAMRPFPTFEKVLLHRFDPRFAANIEICVKYKMYLKTPKHRKYTTTQSQLCAAFTCSLYPSHSPITSFSCPTSSHPPALSVTAPTTHTTHKPTESNPLLSQRITLLSYVGIIYLILMNASSPPLTSNISSVSSTKSPTVPRFC